jgi:hypothetical protein
MKLLALQTVESDQLPARMSQWAPSRKRLPVDCRMVVAGNRCVGKVRCRVGAIPGRQVERVLRQIRRQAAARHPDAWNTTGTPPEHWHRRNPSQTRPLRAVDGAMLLVPIEGELAPR